jgi:hypothetical protein
LQPATFVCVRQVTEASNTCGYKRPRATCSAHISGGVHDLLEVAWLYKSQQTARATWMHTRRLQDGAAMSEAMGWRLIRRVQTWIDRLVARALGAADLLDPTSQQDLREAARRSELPVRPYSPTRNGMADPPAADIPHRAP